MADSVYRVTEVIGVSESWEAAARNAVETAASTVRDLRVAEVVRHDVTIEDSGRGLSACGSRSPSSTNPATDPFRTAPGHYAASTVPAGPGRRDLRASDADREATVERLRVAGMEAGSTATSWRSGSSPPTARAGARRTEPYARRDAAAGAARHLASGLRPPGTA